MDGNIQITAIILMMQCVKIRPLMDGNKTFRYIETMNQVKIRPLMDGNIKQPQPIKQPIKQLKSDH